jgi:hypothetical protein
MTLESGPSVSHSPRADTLGNLPELMQTVNSESDLRNSSRAFVEKDKKKAPALKTGACKSLCLAA